LLALCLSACAAPSADTFCLLASPLRPNGAAWDAADRQFKQEIVLHNETGAALCGWKP